VKKKKTLHPLPHSQTMETNTKNTPSLLPPPSSHLEANTPLRFWVKGDSMFSYMSLLVVHMVLNIFL